MEILLKQNNLSLVKRWNNYYNTSIDTNNLDRLYLEAASDYNNPILDKMHEIDVLKKEEATV